MRLTIQHLREKYLNNRGDTIVEVLIAIAIVSSVLAGAFTVTQKSAVAVRDSQERGEMLQLLQGQVEQVRSLASAAANDSSGVFAAGYFCIKTVSGVPARQNIPSLTSLPALSTDPMSAYGTCQFGTASKYNIAVSYDNSANKKSFTFTGRWDRIRGGKDQLQLTYRVYPGSQ